MKTADVRCSILFHLLAPGGRWHTVISMPSSSASFCNSIFHRRMREPLLPPPSAIIRILRARGYRFLPTTSHQRKNRLIPMVDVLRRERPARLTCFIRLISMSAVTERSRRRIGNWGLGDRSINRSIGSQWGKEGRREALKEHVKDAKRQGKKANVTLTICPPQGATAAAAV